MGLLMNEVDGSPSVILPIQSNVFAGDAMFVLQFVHSGKVFYPVYEAD